MPSELVGARAACGRAADFRVLPLSARGDTHAMLNEDRVRIRVDLHRRDCMVGCLAFVLPLMQEQRCVMRR